MVRAGLPGVVHRSPNGGLTRTLRRYVEWRWVVCPPGWAGPLPRFRDLASTDHRPRSCRAPAAAGVPQPLSGRRTAGTHPTSQRGCGGTPGSPGPLTTGPLGQGAAGSNPVVPTAKRTLAGRAPRKPSSCDLAGPRCCGHSASTGPSRGSAGQDPRASRWTGTPRLYCAAGTCCSAPAMPTLAIPPSPRWSGCSTRSAWPGSGGGDDPAVRGSKDGQPTALLRVHVEVSMPRTNNPGVTTAGFSHRVA